MTCIIGYKDKANGKVYIGSDSCSSKSTGYNDILKNHDKIFKIPYNPNIVVGCCGNPRIAQLLQHHRIFPLEEELKSLDMDFKQYFITTTSHKLIKILADNGISYKYDEPDFAFIIAYKNQLWSIDNALYINESQNLYASDGSGYEYAEGSLLTTKDLVVPITKKILLGLRAGSLDCHVEPPYYIINTKDDEVLKYDE